MKVTYFFREKREGNFSIEELFNTLQGQIRQSVDVQNFHCSRNASIKDIFAARKVQGNVNHITGDVNFLSFGLKKNKTVLTVHDIGHYENTLKGWKRQLYKLIWFSLPFCKVRYITTVSEFTKQNILKHFKVPSHKIIVIPNPVSELFHFSPKAFRKEKPVILQIGSGRNKNISRLIEAVKDIPCKLILIRKPDAALRQQLESQNIDHEFKFNLSYEEIYKNYVACDLVFFASEYEGFGLPIIEANATGRAVITGNISAMPEVAGDAACIVDPFDVTEIRRGIVRIIEDDDYRNNLIAKGLKNAQKFQLARIAEEYLNLYQKVLK